MFLRDAALASPGVSLWGLLCGLILMACPARAEQVAYAFDWQGSGGYAVRGGLSYDTRMTQGPLVVGSDLTCFFIEGFKDGAPIGSWGLAQLNEETDWRMHFDPDASQFLVEGMGVWLPQAWNMDGFGTSCGPGGFGFNIGSAAQDLCLDGSLLVASQVDPFRPFPATRDDSLRFPGYACVGPDLLSMLPRPPQAEGRRTENHARSDVLILSGWQ